MVFKGKLELEALNEWKQKVDIHNKKKHALQYTDWIEESFVM